MLPTQPSRFPIWVDRSFREVRTGRAHLGRPIVLALQDVVQVVSRPSMHRRGVKYLADLVDS